MFVKNVLSVLPYNSWGQLNTLLSLSSINMIKHEKNIIFFSGNETGMHDTTNVYICIMLVQQPKRCPAMN